MKELKHTKGPWICTGNGVLQNKANGKGVCSVRLPSDLEEVDETDANAKLIANAPDMVEILIEIDAIYRTDKNSKIPIVSIRKLIEKATGKPIEEIING
jgi:hypothetical protein